jgi:phage terminase large subunit-like protein
MKSNASNLPSASGRIPAGSRAWRRMAQPMPPAEDAELTDEGLDDYDDNYREPEPVVIKRTASNPRVDERPSEPSKLSLAIKNMTRGQKVIAFIEEFCRVPEGQHVGKRIVLEEFQKKFILDIYDNPFGVITHTAILSMARKNGKTALIGCIAVTHICGPEAKQNSQIISGAMSREQASIVYNYASKMINLDKRLKAVTRLVPSHKQIFGVAKNVEYRAISAEATTAYGLSPVLAILDEMGQIVGPVSPFVEAITTSQGAHENPLLIVISTSAASDADMLSLWIDDALRGDDKAIIVHEYKADANCDLMDVEQWRKANPGLETIRSLKDLEKQCAKATRLPSLENSVRNLLLNQRVALTSKWLAPTPWKNCGGAPDLEVFQGDYIVSCGLDLSSRLDLTAAVFSATDDTGITHQLCYAFTPSDGIRERAERDRAPYEMWVNQGFLTMTPGRTVDYDWVAEFLAIECKNLGITVNVVAFDRWKIEQFKKSADLKSFAQEAEWKEVGQGYKDFDPRVTCYEVLVLNGKLLHGSNPVLNMAAAHAIINQDPAGSRKLDKSKTTQKIDPIVAACMSAFEVAEGADADLDLAGMIA